MYCMKCGKETAEKQAFCKSCLAVMERFPVKPDTPISLPNRSVPVAVKKATPRKKNLSTKERLEKMKKAIQWLSVALAVTVFALFLSITLLIDTMGAETPKGIIGQNYSTAANSSHMD